MVMADLSESIPEHLNDLAEEFLDRFRRGERPSLTEFTSKYPELAEEIRELFPALVMIEDLGSVAGQPALPRTAPIPEHLGDFRIVREIGRGGMGVVYEAVQESLDRHVALKVLPLHAFLEPSLLERFRREARAAAQLHHTNIVPVFGVGEHDGIHYYAMQYIQGQSLEEVIGEVRRLRTGTTATETVPKAASAAAASVLLTGDFEHGAEPNETNGSGPVAVAQVSNLPSTDRQVGNLHYISGRTSGVVAGDNSSLTAQSSLQYFRSVARLGVQVAEALEYAHHQGILHRDIKPSNLLLDLHGIVWITDFGLAKADDNSELTRTGDIVGTIRFMAPERLDGSSEPRSDIYGVGITLYELLTLTPAFADSQRARLIDRIMKDDPPPPRKLDPAIPRDLETIVLKSIAKEPARRYATAEEMAEDLRRFVADRPIQARRASWREQAWRWCRRNPAIAGLTAAVALLLVLVALGSSLTALYLRATLAESEANRKTAHLELGKSLLAQAAALQRTGLLGQRFESLDLLAQAARELRADPKGRELLPQIRDHAITALGLTDLKPLWERPLGIVINLETSQCDYRLERYAFVDYLGTKEIVVRRMEDDRELLRLPSPKADFWHSQMDFSPDGQYLLAWYCLRDDPNHANEPNQRLRVWHLDRKECILDQPVDGNQVLMAAVIHPNRHWLLFPRPEGTIAVWDLEARREIKRLPLGFRPYSLCLDPSGKRVGVNRTQSGGAPLVKILDLDTGQELASWNSQVGGYAMAWSSDGQLLASSSDGGRIYVWHVPRRELASVLHGHTRGVIHAQFARAGHLLATWSWDGTTRLWDAASGEALVTKAGAFWRFSPDDRRLAFRTGTTVGTWEVAHDRECLTLHHGMVGNRAEGPNTLALRGADFSPDGRLLATFGSDGLRLWQMHTGRELAHVKMGSCITLLFHPDGQSLITLSHQGQLHRWPIRSVASPDSEISKIGPPQLIRDVGPKQAFYHAVWMPGHRAVAVTDNLNSRVLIVDLTTPNPASSQPIALASKHKRMTTIAVSPDGQWLAAGGWKERSIQVWNLTTRRLERELPPCDGRGDSHSLVSFSPDGRWLVCATANNDAGGYYFWRVGVWQRELVIGTGAVWTGMPAFRHDGRLMALRMSSQQTLLADPADGRTFAHLTTLQPFEAGACAFSPDGSKLVTANSQRTSVVWDLRLVRERLAAMDLDWDEPAYDEKPRSTNATPFPPLEVQVLGEIPEGADR
jgi:serine/threonine protein kinase/WD40 repeat protein